MKTCSTSNSIPFKFCWLDKLYSNSKPSLDKTRCSDDMRGYLNNAEERNYVLKVFPGKHGVTVQSCKCCDVRAATCSCAGQSGKCSLSLSLETSKNDIDVHQFKKSRAVSDYQKSLVQSKLLALLYE